jgi:PAS domain S-box-containing protein
MSTLVESILSVINNAILIVGSDDKITFANYKAAAMFRCGHLDQLIGQSITRLFMPDDQEILAPNLLQLARNATEFEDEVMLLRFDGTRFIALISTSQFQTNGQQSAILSIHNISGLKGIEKTLRHTEWFASLGRMLDDINHQIRNPVTIIGGFAKRLSKQGIGDSRYADAILGEAERLENLLNTLSAFSSVPQPKIRQVPISAIAQAITATVGPRAQVAGFPLLLECPEELFLATVSIDLDLIIQAISALTDNACEASVAGRQRVSVSIGSSGKSLPYRISIVDQGVGIDPSDRAKIFTPFFSRKSRHHGMGLTLAQRIVAEQGGEITVESNQCHGTTVHIFLVAERRRPIRTRRLKGEREKG